MTALNLSAVSSNVGLIGGAWMLSSSIFTTYYTNQFLRFDKSHEYLKEAEMNPWKDIDSIQVNKSTEWKQRSPSLFLTDTYKSISRSQLLTLYRFGGSLFIGLLPNIGARLIQTRKVTHYFIFPAFCLFIANYFNSIALERLGISLTYTTKCAIPLITVFVTIFTEGFHGLPNVASLCSLIPIAIGIALASWNSPVFELYGFIAAVISTISQVFLNISSKKAMTLTKLGGLEAQRAMAFLAAGITLSVVILNIITKQIVSSLQPYNPRSATVWKGNPPFTLSFAASAAYHVEYVLSFLFVKLVQPITYGAFDAVRRLGIIIAGRAMFGGEKFTFTNRVGVIMTLLGAFFYSVSLAK